MTVGELLDTTLALVKLPAARERLDDYRACRRAIERVREVFTDHPELTHVLDNQLMLLRLREVAVINETQSHHRAGETRGAKVSEDARELHRQIRKAHIAALQVGEPLTQSDLARRFEVTTRTVRTALARKMR